MREGTLRGWSALRTVWALAALMPALACGSSSETFVAPTPSRCAVQARPDTASFEAGGGSGNLRITTNRECEWSVATDAAWLALQAQPRGQGDGSVQFRVAANSDPAARNAGLSVNDQRVQISQQGRPCQFRLSSTHESVESSGGQRTVRVEATSDQCTWSATSDAAWISVVEGRSGKGNGAVVFEIPALGGPPRSGTLTIAGQKVQVEQGMGCTYVIRVTRLNVSASGGVVEVPVEAPDGCPWTAQSQSPWISIASGASGRGAGSVTMSVAPTDGPGRTGTVVVADISVTIAQAGGCEVNIEPASIDAPPAGGPHAISVRTGPGCSWSAESDTEWMTVLQGGGSGPGQLVVLVAPNNSPPRTGSITIAGETVMVRQPSLCTWTFSPPAQQFPSQGGRGTILVTVSGACTWTAERTVGWIVLSRGRAGSGSGVVEFTVAANAGPARVGVLRIAEIEYEVRQAGR